MSSAVNRVQVDLRVLFQAAELGVQRAALFMGFGLNAAHDPSFIRYQLGGIAGLEFVPPESTSGQLGEFKKRYGESVLLSGCRDLIEVFEALLDEIHDICTKVAIIQGRQDQAEGQKKHKQFTRWGLEYKLKKMKESFSILSEKEEALVSLSRARNTIVHRRATVGTDDGPDGVTVKWWGFDLLFVAVSGEITSLPAVFPAGGIELSNGTVYLKSSVRERIFLLNEIILFSARDVTEMCLMVRDASREILSSLEAYLESVGFNKNETDHVGEVAT